MKDPENVKLNYNLLYEISRQERAPELQRLPENFYKSALKLLSSLSQATTTTKSPEEFEDAERVCMNAKKLLESIYGCRESKIIDLASRAYLLQEKAKDMLGIINTSDMLPEEIVMYNAYVSIFMKFRKEILDCLLRGELPNVTKGITADSRQDIQLSAGPKL